MSHGESRRNDSCRKNTPFVGYLDWCVGKQCSSIFPVCFGVQSGFALWLEPCPSIVKALFAAAGMGLKTESKITKYGCSKEHSPFCFSINTAFDKEF